MNHKLYIPFRNSKHTLILGVLSLCIIAVVQGQIKPGKLKQEIQQKMNPVTPISKKRKPKPLAPLKPVAPLINPTKKPGSTLIYLENTESLSFDQAINPDLQILKGNVRFRHDNAILYCDSAYFYQKANSIDAFSNIRIVQGDTLTVYGDFLYYDGNTKLARLRKNVRLINRETRLITDSLNYNRAINMAYYYKGGKIIDKKNTMTSLWGQYSPNNNEAFFRTNVDLVNQDFTLKTDSLRYNTQTNVANLIGKTHIVYQKETNIYSTKGWYNTATNQMMLLNRSLIHYKDGKTVTGDTVYYDKKKQYGEVYSKGIVNDSIGKTTLYGNYLYYNEKSENSIATDSALMVDWSSKDTLWMHADTLNNYKDSSYSVSSGYKHVRIFRNDVQSICDSLVYSTRDSVMTLYGSPVLWSDNNQMSAQKIQVYRKNGLINRIYLESDAMSIQQEDSLHFNQLSGKEITAYIENKALREIHVKGNAESIFYPRDDKDSSLVGMNKTESSFIKIYIKNKKMERMVMTTASNGTMYPLEKTKPEDSILKNFKWEVYLRPKNDTDVLCIPENLQKNK